MHLTASDIFWKSWWWSIVCGAAIGIAFYAITSLFDWGYWGLSFVDFLITLSILGSYFGAGYVGWRIVCKYHQNHRAQFITRYRQYSIVTFALLVALAFSPLSFLGVFWSFAPPFGVLQAIRHARASQTRHR